MLQSIFKKILWNDTNWDFLEAASCSKSPNKIKNKVLVKEDNQNSLDFLQNYTGLFAWMENWWKIFFPDLTSSKKHTQQNDPRLSWLMIWKIKCRKKSCVTASPATSEWTALPQASGSDWLIHQEVFSCRRCDQLSSWTEEMLFYAADRGAAVHDITKEVRFTFSLWTGPSGDASMLTVTRIQLLTDLKRLLASSQH